MKLEFHKELVKKVHYSSTKDSDLKAYYRAYQMDSFGFAHEQLSADANLSFEEFVVEFVATVKRNNLLTITFFAQGDNGPMQIGMGFFWLRSNLLEIANVVWFPWTSSRQVFSSFFNFFEGIRRTPFDDFGSYYQVLEFSSMKDSKFFDKFVEMGVLQRGGSFINSNAARDSAIIYTTLPVQEG